MPVVYGSTRRADDIPAGPRWVPGALLHSTPKRRVAELDVRWGPVHRQRSEDSLRKWLRKIRGIVGMGALWGAIGMVSGAVVGGLESLFSRMPVLASMLGPAIELGVLGLLAGSGFAVVFTALEGRRTLSELSLFRAALWGGIAGAALPATFLLIQGGWAGLIASVSDPRHSFLLASVLSGIIPGALASGTLFLARRSSGTLPTGGETGPDPVLKLPADI